MKKLICCCLLATVFCLLTSAAHAQEVGLMLSPPVVQLYIQPGKTIRVNFTLQNTGDPVILKPLVVSMKPADAYGNVTLGKKSAGPITFSFEESKVASSEGTLLLKSNQSTTIPVTIAVPASAPEADYDNSLLIQTQPPPSDEGSITVQTQVSVASHLLITVTKEGQLNSKGTIESFTLSGTSLPNSIGKQTSVLEGTAPFAVNLKISNSGTNLTTVKGYVELKGFFRDEKWPIVPAYVLQNSDRLIQVQSSYKSPCTSKICSSVRSFLVPPLVIGNYSLTAHVTFGANVQEATSTLQVSVFPIQPLLAALFVVIIIILIRKIIFTIKIKDS